MRIGKFRVSRELVENHHDEVVEMFCQLKIVVVRAEMMYAGDYIEYMGISPKFKDNDLMYIPPEYTIVSHR